MDELSITIRYIFMTCISLFLGITWLAGFAFSGSSWAIIPFYACYRVIEKAMNYYHIFGYTS